MTDPAREGPDDVVGAAAARKAAVAAVEAQVDALYAAMQAPGAHEATIRALHGTPEALGRAAVAAVAAARREAARRAAWPAEPDDAGGPPTGAAA